MMTESPKNAKQNREKMCQCMFEEFHVIGFYVQVQAVLALYASGRTTGIVLDSGDGVTHAVPIYEGYSLPHAVGRADLAGRDLTDYMQICMQEQGFNFTTTAEMEIVREVKEKLAYVLPRQSDVRQEENLKQAMDKCAKDKSLTKEFVLPDGNTIKLSFALFKCPELLFKPELNGKEIKGIH